MESDSQLGDSGHNSCFMPLSLGGVCAHREEEASQRMMPNATSQSMDWVRGSGPGDPGMTRHNCRENCSLSNFEYLKDSMGKRRIRHYGLSKNVFLEDDLKLGLGLGLGCPPCPRDDRNRLDNGICSGTSCLEGRKQDNSLVDLDLGLTRTCRLELTNNWATSSRALFSKVTSQEQASQYTETEGCVYDRFEAGSHRTALIQLENLQGSSRNLNYGGDAVRDSISLISASGENTCGMDLQLGLSATPYSADSDHLSYFIGNAGDAQENGPDFTAGGCIPLLDEGSTSARWMKSKGHIASVLQCGQSRFNQTNSLSPAIPLPEGASEPDLPVRKNAATVSGSADEAFTSLSGQNPRLTASDSSIGALARSSDRASKMCKFRGCGKGARGASGLCIAHGGGRRCQRPNCNKGAEGRTMYCKAHGGGRRCQRLGCIKSAEGKTDFCIGHGGGRRCNTEGCNKAARGRSGLCIRHGGGKRCQKEGCTKSAEGYAGLCISHGGGRRCQYAGCGKGAQGSTMYCKAHGGGRRCEFEGCTKGAEGSTPRCKAHGGGKRCMFGGGTCTKSVHGGTLFCVAHGGGKRCAVPGCTKSARGRTDHCVRHGGGKRCKFENCSKSAQGSTDFCKAHGGGKKCSWCQEGSTCGEEVNDKAMDHLKKSCDRFARGKTGLCAAHNALMQKSRVSWDGNSCSSYSKGTMPDGVTESVSRSIHTDHSFPPFSDASEQPSQFSSDHDELPSGTAESQLVQCARASIEGPHKRRHDHMENESCHVSKSKRVFTSDVVSQVVNLDGGCMDISSLHMECPSSWLFPQLSFQRDGVAGKQLSFQRDGVTGKQHPYILPGDSVQRPESSFSSTQVMFSSSMLKDDLLLRDNMQHLGHVCSLSASDNISSMLSLSFPEERVHGGGLLALLAKEAAKQSGLQ